MKNETTAKRLSLALNNANMKAQELSERSGVSKASISQYINGTHAPSNFSAAKMATVLSVSPVWLMGFDVPMIEGDDNPQITCVLTPDESTLLNDYQKLNDLGKKKARDDVSDLTEIPRYQKEPDHLMVQAAHAHDDATSEQIKHDNDVMDNDSLWEG